jgi:tetratricopeptide (TPR) repeat protein
VSSTGSLGPRTELPAAAKVDYVALGGSRAPRADFAADFPPDAREEIPEPARERPVASARSLSRGGAPLTLRVGADGRCVASRPVRTMSAQAALSLGWCLMEANRPLQAVPAFDRALEMGDAATRQQAAYGKTLAYLRKDLTAHASVAATDAPQSRQRNAEVGAVILEQRALAAFRDGRYVEAIFALEDRTRLAPEQNDLLLMRGYSYLRLGRFDDATRTFRAVQRAGLVAEGGAGLNAVLQATGVIRGE